jgi:hypothetical protein
VFKLSTIFLLQLVFLTNTYASPLCKKWSTYSKIADLDQNHLLEVSGLAWSLKDPQRLYHVNDSGDGPRVYLTDVQGNFEGFFDLLGVNPVDIEALGIGRCPGIKNENCLFIADIGDNLFRRDWIELIIIKEQLGYAPLVDPLIKMRLRYPDKAHNAEGIAIHPNGDLILITKEKPPVGDKIVSAKVYRLKPELMAHGTVALLDQIGEIDLPVLLSKFESSGQIVTGFDIHPSGSKFLMLTYMNFVEVKLDISKPMPPVHSWKEGVDYNVVVTPTLPQTESIIYTPDDKTILISSEKRKGVGPYLGKVECLEF